MLLKIFPNYFFKVIPEDFQFFLPYHALLFEHWSIETSLLFPKFAIKNHISISSKNKLCLWFQFPVGLNLSVPMQDLCFQLGRRLWRLSIEALIRLQLDRKIIHHLWNGWNGWNWSTRFSWFVPDHVPFWCSQMGFSTSPWPCFQQFSQ